MEILAPAGGMEHLTAAVRGGANAVYLGTGNFNARRNAQNFGKETLPEAVSYCHARNVKVYAALNTLVLDREMEALAEEIALLAESSVDGVIVQDTGVAAMVRALCPGLALHASTQMTVHSVAGAKAIRRVGFKRVVLARELSAKEIGSIAAETDLELEVFVHGALCMSVSGQCYLSAILGERSGNRGLCAQPCRLNFTSGGRDYALSLKDLSLMEHMEALKAAGVSSLKIEGRMKRPEYVYAAVTACKAALKGEKPDIELLRAVFSRSGFTDGYFTGKRGLAMFGSRTKEDVVLAAPVLKNIAASYRNEAPLVPADMRLTVRKGRPCVLTVTDGTHTVTRQGPVPETAVHHPLSEFPARQSLQKTGGTPFYLREFASDIEDGLMLRVSDLNLLRKEALEELLTLRSALSPLPFFPDARPRRTDKRPLPAGGPGLRIRLRNTSQLSDFLAESADTIILPVEEIASDPGLIAQFAGRLAGELPLLSFPDTEENLRELLQGLRRAGLSAVTAGNIGTVSMARELGFAVLGDYSLNVVNSYACAEYRSMGAADLTLSFELNIKQARAIRSEIPIGLIAYGRLPLMTFRNCPVRGAKGCAGCTGVSGIRDRLGNAFPVACRNKAYSQLLNMLPLYMGDRAEELTGLDFTTLYFTIEDAAQCEEITRLYLARRPFPGKHTRGLYFRDLK